MKELKRNVFIKVVKHTQIFYEGHGNRDFGWSIEVSDWDILYKKDVKYEDKVECALIEQKILGKNEKLKNDYLKSLMYKYNIVKIKVDLREIEKTGINGENNILELECFDEYR